MKKPLKRRIWGICLFCLTGLLATFVWSLYRPLNHLEQQLVGTWRNTTVTSAGVFTLNTDRSISVPRTGRTGEFWRVEGNELLENGGFADEFARSMAHILLRVPQASGGIVSIIDADHFKVFVRDNGGTFYFERVTPRSAGSVDAEEPQM